jgi:hypothetical protein
MSSVLYRLTHSRRALVQRRERETAAAAALIAITAICELQRGQAPTD